MTACRRCGAEIHERYVGTVRIWAHVNRSIDHLVLPPIPPRKVAPPTESEKRAMWGDR